MVRINIPMPAGCKSCPFKGARLCYIAVWLRTEYREVPEEGRAEWCPMEEVGGWIPVAEKQPELTHFMYDVTPFSDTVLVTMRNQYGAERLVLGNYEQRKGWNFELLNSTDERFQWHAIAWRPLPKAYREDTND